MRDFKEGGKEDFYSGSRAAVAGGITTYIDMPNSKPPVVDAQTFKRRLRRASQKSVADFGLNFGVTKENWAAELEVEPTAYKIYVDGTLGEVDEQVIEGTLELRDMVAVHAEEPGLFVGPQRPPKAEIEAVRKVGAMAEQHREKVHICHVSSRRSLRYLNSYTSCEVTPHHLFLTEKDLKEYGGIAKTNPPLRSAKDIKALWEGLKNGGINAIVSDHAPHKVRDKERGFDEAPPGIPNLDVMLKLFLTAVNQGRITLPELVRWMCENPARLLGLEGKGALSPGMDADIVVLDMGQKGRIEVDEFFSKAKYSPFEDRKVIGSVDKVFLRGKLVYEEGAITAKRGYGKPLKKATPSPA
jgi:dihydroorotase